MVNGRKPEHYFEADSPSPCGMCRKPTTRISILDECALCSDECDAMYDEQLAQDLDEYNSRGPAECDDAEDFILDW